MPDLVWNLFVELRKEVLEAQKIRAQILGFKFTFITASMAIIVVNLKEPGLDCAILVIPALAAIFFDFIICSYSFSIKRIGCYVREIIEPELKKNFSNNFIMWQEYLTQPKTKQYLSIYGNISVTILSVVIGIIGIFANYRPILSPLLFCVLVVFTIMDVIAYREPLRFRE